MHHCEFIISLVLNTPPCNYFYFLAFDLYVKCFLSVGKVWRFSFARFVTCASLARHEL